MSKIDERPILLSQFPVRTSDKIRYADTDRQGHVNNAVFSTYLETGRVEILYDPARPLTTPGASFVIASLSLDYRGEIRWPGTVDIGTTVTRIGNSSLRFHQALFQDGRLVATADTVIVQMDEETRRSSPLAESTRKVLAEIQISGAKE